MTALMTALRLPQLLAVLIVLAASALSASAQGGQGGSQGGGQAVPVTATAATRRDVPVFARGIGTVDASQTVVVRARVDGTLDQVLFTEGQEVQAGDVLAVIDPRPYKAALDQAVARKLANEAQLAAARSDLQRYVELSQSQAASRQRLETARAAALQYEAAVRGDDAAIAIAALNLAFTQVTSPISGRVGLRAVDAGNLIRGSDTAGAGIATVSQTRPISVLFTLPQGLLPRVRAAMGRGELPVAAVGADGRERLAEGRLLTIDNAVDAATGTIRLKATFPNESGALWPGAFVNVRLQLDVLRDAVTVPSGAVQRGAAGTFVFLVKPDGTAAAQPVEVAQSEDGVAVIARGLEGAERVVLSGHSRLANGVRVAATDTPPAS